MQLLRAFVLALGVASLPAFAQENDAAPPVPLPRPAVTFPPQKIAYPGGVSAQFDIAYETPADLHPLTLDIYTPKPSPTPLPFVVFVHGGGWDSGDSRHALAFADLPRALAGLAAQGYVVASVNYRLSQEAHFPAALQDVKAAIRWLRGHAADYGGDSTRLAAWGMSAGGQLAAMAGAACGVARFEPDGKIDYTAPSDCVEAVIDWFGPTDLSPSGANKNRPAPTPEGRYLGCEPAACAPGIVRLASPLAFISENTPPFLIQQGEADTAVAPAQSQALYDALKKRGVPAELVLYPGVGHGFQKDGKPDADTVTQAMDKIAGFLAATFPKPRVKSPPRRGDAKPRVSRR
ncbi:MAG TPA: alpha/beta hydrolase [Rhizomicrobium sp.]|nr:alpha/beta hydrolase [Rhizomicrobium sp.]